MIELVQHDIERHALDEYPREACGVIVRDVLGAHRYLRCNNVAPHALNRDAFEIDPRDLAQAEEIGEICAVVHSHPDASATPSATDRRACAMSGLAWYVIAVPGLQITRVPPTDLPLVGRQFEHGLVDCYTLVQDYYWQECRIKLPDFERADQWWTKGQDLYVANFAAAGFVSLPLASSMYRGDALLMHVGSRVTNHAAVYVGDGVILHHLYGRLSGRDVWGGYWRERTTHLLRHGSLL